jgi:hypothetical protein
MTTFIRRPPCQARCSEKEEKKKLRKKEEEEVAGKCQEGMKKLANKMEEMRRTMNMRRIMRKEKRRMKRATK